MAAMIHKIDRWIFIWYGREDIDIYTKYSVDLGDVFSDGYRPNDRILDQINIWDYGIDKPSIRLLSDFVDECEKWVARQYADYGNKTILNPQTGLYEN